MTDRIMRLGVVGLGRTASSILPCPGARSIFSLLSGARTQTKFFTHSG
jgi:hypothetical protein